MNPTVDNHRRPWSVIQTNISDVILGESPVWSSVNNCLYWIDIDGRRIHRTYQKMNGEYHTDTIQLTIIPGTLGLIENHPTWIWIGTDDGIYIFDWTTLESCQIAPFPESRQHRFNDGKVDPDGDIIIGSMITASDAKKRKDAGRVWRISFQTQHHGHDGGNTPAPTPTQSVIHQPCTIPNGLDWVTSTASTSSSPSSLASSSSFSSSSSSSPSHSFFHIDTPTECVTRLDEPKDRSSSPYYTASTVFSTKSLKDSTGNSISGQPDGMVIDRDGFFWIAMPNSTPKCLSHVCRFSSRGELVSSYQFPVSKVTSLCFGGPTMSDLFITSASKGVKRELEPLAGAIFHIHNVVGQTKCDDDISISGKGEMNYSRRGHGSGHDSGHSSGHGSGHDSGSNRSRSGGGGEMNHLKGHFHRLVNNFRSQPRYQHHELMRVNINRGGVDRSQLRAKL